MKHTTAWERWRRRRAWQLTLPLFAFIIQASGVDRTYAQSQPIPPIEEQAQPESSAQPETISKQSAADPLLQQAKGGGRVRVIVGLKQAAQALRANVLAEAEATEAIASAQESVLDSLAGHDVTPVAEFDHIPYMAIEVDEDALQALIDSDEILSIEEDVADSPTLASTIPIVGADDAHTAGYSGSGQTVAILDTGIQGLHPFFGGRIVSEACYSNAAPTATRRSLCPGGGQAQVGPGAAEVTVGQCVNGGSNLCRHGSHVAGIAAGNGASFTGVAKNANIIAIQVFTRFNSAADCAPSSAPCVRSFTSDQIKGLERVYALRTTYNIAAANMSLGGGKFTSEASCDTAQSSRKAIIDLLRAAKTATVIASGNNGFSDGLNAPGCISSATSVGATNDSDVVAGFSNSASFLDILAPGVSVDSSVPTNAFANFQGTSMAAPHVAGAFAVYKQLNPTATVTAIENALKSSGKPVTDARNGITKPRLDIGKAIQNGGGRPQASIIQLFPVSGAKTGGQARLWALVKNTGSAALPAGSRVQYWVNGPAWVGNHFVGTVNASGLAAGASRWYLLNWNISCARPPGAYTYWARVIQGNGTPISAWKGPQAFTVAAQPSAVVQSLFRVPGARQGVSVNLWARVQNTGCFTLPADTKVDFWVDGPSWAGSHTVGQAAAGGLVPGATRWYRTVWAIGFNRPAGEYRYHARVQRANIAISPWKGPQNFTVTGRGFASTFNGSFAPWRVINGNWSSVSNAYLYTPGTSGEVSSVSYPFGYQNFDYQVRYWRNGSQMFNANRIIVRGAPFPLNGSVKRWNRAYLFQTSKSGQFSVWESNGNSSTPIQSWTASAAVQQSGWNLLRVRVVGPSMRFYINGQLVFVGNDPSFTAGLVGIGMYRSPGSSANGFWIDHASLTVLNANGTLSVGTTDGGASDSSGSAGDGLDESLATELSAEQHSLNDLANAQPQGTVDEAPVVEQDMGGSNDELSQETPPLS